MKVPTQKRKATHREYPDVPVRLRVLLRGPQGPPSFTQGGDGPLGAWPLAVLGPADSSSFGVALDLREDFPRLVSVRDLRLLGEYRDVSLFVLGGEERGGKGDAGGCVPSASLEGSIRTMTPEDQPDEEPSLDWFAERLKRKPRPKAKAKKLKRKPKKKGVERRGRPRKSTPRTIGPIPWDDVPASATTKEDVQWAYANMYHARIFHETGPPTPDFGACTGRPPSMGALAQLEYAVRDSEAWLAKVHTPMMKTVVDTQELKQRDKMQRVDIEEILKQFVDAGERR